MARSAEFAIGPPVKDRAIEPVGDGGERGDFPVAEMAGEEQRRLAVIPELLEQPRAARIELDTAVLFRMLGS